MDYMNYQRLLYIKSKDCKEVLQSCYKVKLIVLEGSSRQGLLAILLFKHNVALTTFPMAEN